MVDIGTQFDNSLVGTNNDDVLRAVNGYDRLFGLAGSGSSTLIGLKNAEGSIDTIGQINTTNLSFAQDFTFV